MVCLIKLGFQSKGPSWGKLTADKMDSIEAFQIDVDVHVFCHQICPFNDISE